MKISVRKIFTKATAWRTKTTLQRKMRGMSKRWRRRRERRRKGGPETGT